MILVNIDEEVKDLEASGEVYETKIDTFYDDNKNLTHKHVVIPAINKSYVRTNDLQWHLIDSYDNCPLCNN